MRKRWRLMLNVFTASASAGCSSQAASRLTSSERQFPNDRYESFSDEAILRTDEDSKIPTPCRCSTDTSAMLCVTSRSENRLQSSRSRDTAREKTPVVAVDCLNGTCCSEATASTDKLVSVSPMQLEERSRSTWVLGWQVRLPWPQRLRIRDEPSARIRASENESHTTGANESAHGMETWRIFHSFSRDLISLSSWLTIRRLSSGFHEWSSDDEPPLDPYAPLIISAARPDDPESSEQVQSVSHEMSLFSDNQNSRWRGHLQSTSADNGELGLTASAVQTTQSLPSTVSGVPDDEYTTSTANSVRTPFMISGRLQERLQRLTLNLHIFSGDSNPSFVRHDQLANMGSSSFEDLSILDHTQRYHSDSTGVLEDRGFDSETIDKYTRLGHVQWNCRPTDQVPSTLSREEDKVSSSGYQRLDGSQEARSRRSTSELSTFQPPADRCVICLEPMQV
ncbi:hypothetical protein F1559_003725 [Cyanidiococcus yangmingshanensis]|uniref:Uncharacterized protein n=1 Tax=Cyanidiococcus yangmingshanensis TaxID=2690220 RepID=A0A7J7IIZ0_9RHOD|nr:hypothetical protein F1559_003725 [Cyanidiococcus yangmingshanensis]